MHSRYYQGKVISDKGRRALDWVEGQEEPHCVADSSNPAPAVEAQPGLKEQHGAAIERMLLEKETLHVTI
jgi:hypothetical protein